ncbi:hypothetical protein TRFO_17681 [Tritrichomonas foetus]|uniref:Uncharacterized protein n=1 Tax=Tritrichomonas foetus TaxID=1144522 RepID=A0A1J4KRX8_9EUKA|nr:hypothetical protein TRFO_17681 [Tritrichomonas foetus]|eukprot:OHT12422.1 hypothetical protein TRFO_17681 [Tritrichomonas foetus]
MNGENVETPEEEYIKTNMYDPDVNSLKSKKEMSLNSKIILQIIPVQNSIYNLPKMHSVNDVFELIKETDLLNTKLAISQILITIEKAFINNKGKKDVKVMYFELISLLSPYISENFSSNELCNRYFRDDEIRLALLEYGLLNNPHEIVNIIKRKEKKEEKEKLYDFYKEFIHQYQKEILSINSQLPEIPVSDDWFPFLTKKIENLHKFQGINLEKGLSKEEKMLFDSYLLDCIKTDEIDEFQNIISSTNIPINYVLSLPNQRNISLMNASVFYGSINIFRFLYLNGANHDYTTYGLASVSGNCDIIHILEKNNIFNVEFAKNAIRFCRNDIFDYFLENKNSESELTDGLIMDFLKISIGNFNYDVFYRYIDILENKPNCTQLIYEETIKSGAILMFTLMFELFSHHFVKYNVDEYVSTAMEYGSVEIIKYMLDNKVISINHNFLNILRAAELNHRDLVKYLVFTVHKPFLQETNESNQNVFHIAALYDWDDILDLFNPELKAIPNEELQEYLTEINLPDITKQTPLHIAVVNHSLNFIRKMSTLVPGFVDFNTLDIDGNTPFLLSIEVANLEIVKFFLCIEVVDQQCENNSKCNALHIAAKHGFIEIFEFLLENSSIDISRKDSEGETPLHLAAYYGQIDLTKIILNKCQNPSSLINSKDNTNNTPLHMAAYGGFDEIISIFLQYDGVDVNVLTHNNETPLHWACENGCLKAVQTLCSCQNIDISIKDSNGKTAIDKAIENNESAIVDFLKTYLY